MSWYSFSGFSDEVDQNLDVQKEWFGKLGIKYMEPRFINGKNVSTLSLEEAKEIKKSLDKDGFKVSALGSPIGKIKITDPFDDELALFRHVLKIAQIFETDYIRIFSFYMPEDEDPLKYRDEVLRRLNLYAKETEGSGITLLHENEGSAIYGQSAESCRDLIESVGSHRLKATLDAGNFIVAGFDPWESYKILEPYVEYLHIKDTVGGRNFVPPGMGIVPYKKIFTSLKEKNRHFFISLEPHIGRFEKYIFEDGREILGEGNKIGNFVLSHKSIKKVLDMI